MNNTNYLQNRLPNKSQQGKLIPEKTWAGKKQDVNYFRVFKSPASVEIPKRSATNQIYRRTDIKCSLTITLIYQSNFKLEPPKPGNY